MRNFTKRVLSLIIALAVCFTLAPASISRDAEAASKYISVGYFCRFLATEIGLSPVSGSNNIAYVNALIEKGIIKDGEFTSYTDWLTRGDTLVLLNRADEFLYGDTLDAELVQTALDKRISDIDKVIENKRTDVAKGYLKGFLKGYSNGLYSTDRDLNLESKMTKSGSLSCIKMLKDESKRARISPDGQLIRTTNLPKYAKYYPYILSSYPNAYYDWKFLYEGQVKTNPETMESIPYKNIEDYAAPVDMDKIKDFENFKEVKEEYLEEWVEKVRTYMECVFNVDYRTIDDQWIDKIMSVDYSFGHDGIAKQTKDKIKQYIADMKKNKTIVESSKIAVDGSSLYFNQGRYLLRVYVKYRIVSSTVEYGVDADTLIYENPYGDILYTRYPLVSLNNFKLGQWKEGYFDVEMGWYSMKKPDNIGVFYAILNECYYNKRRVK